MSGLVVVLLAGFAGSFHCVGMCGGFVCGLAQLQRDDKRALFLHALLYNSGRLVTYAFIGALAGSFGILIMGTPEASFGEMGHAHGLAHDVVVTGGLGNVLAGDMGSAQRILSIIAGFFMLVMAMELFGLRRHMPKSWAHLAGAKFAQIFRTLVLSRHPAAPLVLGVANGFLPCPLVFAFSAVAATTGGVLPAVLTMTAFGLGTFPAMFLMGTIGIALSPLARIWGVRLAGTFVLVIALLTLVRGIQPDLFHGAGHAMHVM